MFKYKLFIFILISIISAFAFACQICSGDKMSDDEAGILKMYKQKSEYYGRKNRTEAPSVKSSDLECDFTKGNDHCKRMNQK